MKFSVVLFPLLLVVLFYSCKKKDDEGIKVYVPNHIKAMAPYTQGQRVNFSNGSGHNIQADVSINSVFYNVGVCGSCANHPNPETLTYTLKVGTANFAAFVLTPDTYIQLTVYSPINNYQSSAGFNFSAEKDVPQHSCVVTWSQRCLSSITLNGKTFTNVLEISSSSPDLNAPQKAYHTVSKGLVGFTFQNGTIYTLD